MSAVPQGMAVHVAGLRAELADASRLATVARNTFMYRNDGRDDATLESAAVLAGLVALLEGCRSHVEALRAIGGETMLEELVNAIRDDDDEPGGEPPTGTLQ